LDEPRTDLLDFTRFLIQFFHRHPVLRRRKFFQGRPVRGSEVEDVTWFRPDGEEMTERDWHDASRRSIAVRLAGDAIDETDERGRRITDDTLLLLLNAHHEPMTFILPSHREEVRWHLAIDTRAPNGRRRNSPRVHGGGKYRLVARSLALFILHGDGNARGAGDGD
jgi:glycogen operon protein